MKRKKTLTALFITSIFVMLVSSGCYTKFYRPGMEMDGPYSSSELYNRYDSSAIDTTLTKGDYFPDYYPDNSWYYSGGYMTYPRTRWGFDFYNFSPGYYQSYYGYYDYYGTPWWNRYDYNRNNWWYRGGYGGGYNTSPGEPPEQRDGRRQRDSYSGGGAVYTQPSSTVTTTPTTQTTQAKPAPQPDNSRSSATSNDSGSSQKRTGKRRR